MKPNKTRKLTFKKTEFRVLDPRELGRIKGGNGEMILNGEMVLVGQLDDSK